MPACWGSSVVYIKYTQNPTSIRMSVVSGLSCPDSRTSLLWFMLHSSQFNPLQLQHHVTSLTTPCNSCLSFIDRTRILRVLMRSDILLWEKLVFSPNFYFPSNSIVLPWLLGAMWTMRLTGFNQPGAVGSPGNDIQMTPFRWMHNCPARRPLAWWWCSPFKWWPFHQPAFQKASKPRCPALWAWAACYCRPLRPGDYTVLSSPAFAPRHHSLFPETTGLPPASNRDKCSPALGFELPKFS